MPLFPLLCVLGVGAGLLTTLAGVGGSLFAAVSLSVLYSPELALSVTAPAMLVGNAHRLFLFRAALRDKECLRNTLIFVALATPAAFLGGLLAVQLSGSFLHWALVVALVAAMTQELRLFRRHVGERTLIPAALSTGFLTATVGGGSMLMGPALLASGLRAEAFVASCAAASVGMNLARIPAYMLGGWFGEGTWTCAGMLAASVMAGNFMGQSLRRGLSDETSRRFTWATLLCGTLVATLAIM